ncbi:penicillin-binding protein activator LpoB [Candidatus Poribacteria bacterium]|jgi:penicillin-binding protein activator|nr:penicillin-binding protein activator LpoB [Candidatus Poribacteria bacterium]MBT5535465.1 penicillin-binding protein activator LpoB [Candidatus Poribacteria bacterium]MBT5712769.1 penicillin-binding protein activator LpoB [Candidatus Poribacteria bacterium]MBT7097979.1 penicillin-binding protein activator LpoB [Candidatus Poribacteria bacterium]MBT7807705.1 penicillin-binding protein activator LpoB [Candidatus Poribacteria bacterium]
MKRHLLLGPTLLAIALAVGCGSSKSVARIDPNEVIDLSGRWNDTDSRQVSETMVLDCLNHPWITQHMTRAEGDRPVVIVGAVRNRSMEHIPVGTFVADIERAFINSGRVSVVSSAQERGELRDEKEDQRKFASLETIKQMGQELGADYMMTGEVNTIEDREGGKQVLYYQTDLQLTDIETNEKIWLGQDKIKKFVERKRTVL